MRLYMCAFLKLAYEDTKLGFTWGITQYWWGSIGGRTKANHISIWLYEPVQAAAVGSVKQLFIEVTSVLSVVQVVPEHFPASTAGRAVAAPYVP